jgi:hypothetical protein
MSMVDGTASQRRSLSRTMDGAPGGIVRPDMTSSAGQNTDGI